MNGFETHHPSQSSKMDRQGGALPFFRKMIVRLKNERYVVVPLNGEFSGNNFFKDLLLGASAEK